MTDAMIRLNGGMVCTDGICTIPNPTASGHHPQGVSMNSTTAPLTSTREPHSAVTAEKRFAILDTIYRYATGIDARDWVLFRAAFTDDATVDVGFAQWVDGDSFATFMRETHDPAGRTLHRMSNTVVTRTDDGTLTARTYGDAVVLQADNTTGTIANAWYDDTFAATEDGYRISSRTVHMISMRTIGPNLAAEI
jgi:3-phenylpropionate/cinnamic acid dioxygenase small subunit